MSDHLHTMNCHGILEVTVKRRDVSGLPDPVIEIVIQDENGKFEITAFMERGVIEPFDDLTIKVGE